MVLTDNNSLPEDDDIVPISVGVGSSSVPTKRIHSDSDPDVLLVLTPELRKHLKETYIHHWGEVACALDVDPALIRASVGYPRDGELTYVEVFFNRISADGAQPMTIRQLLDATMSQGLKVIAQLAFPTIAKRLYPDTSDVCSQEESTWKPSPKVLGRFSRAVASKWEEIAVEFNQDPASIRSQLHAGASDQSCCSLLLHNEIKARGRTPTKIVRVLLAVECDGIAREFFPIEYSKLKVRR